MTDKEKDRITRAEAIQLYTENRCSSLEKENEDIIEILYLWYCQFKDNMILLDKDLIEQTETVLRKHKGDL